jgi:HlyD family type I secretion membrane fusion protein
MNPSVATIPSDTRFDTRLFYAVAATFLTVFIVWGCFAELDAGAVATGEVVPAGRVKTIQHLEGGIIQAITVREGAQVKAGDELLRLDDTPAKAQLAIAETELAAQEALVERLTAERDGKPYQPSAELAGAPSAAAQLRLFEARHQALQKEISGLDARLAGLRRELQSWGAKDTALAQLRANADEENKLNRRLYDQGFISRPRLLQLESQRADSAARQSDNSAEMARVKQRIADTELSIARLKNEWMNTLLEDLRKAQDAAQAAGERAGVARDRLARTRIVAPQDGLVNGLKYSTLGGVVPPGGALLDLVPVGEPLVVEARVLPDDIDVVHAGQTARVRLTAYKARSHISLVGTVKQVSASTMRDEASQGHPFYKAHVEIGPEELAKVDNGMLTSGMLAQVDIVAGKRSAMRYLFDPIIDSMQRAFKEA